MHTSTKSVKGTLDTPLLLSPLPIACRIIEFKNKRDMYNALEKMQGKKLNGRAIKLSVERVYVRNASGFSADMNVVQEQVGVTIAVALTQPLTIAFCREEALA